MGIHLDSSKNIVFSDPQERFHIERYKKISELVKHGDLILDVGSAEGWGGYYLATHTKANKIIVVDLDAKAIARSRQNFPATNIEYKEGNVLKLPFPDNYFDIICACELIEHLEAKDQNPMLTEIKRILKPGGFAAISTTDKNRNFIRAIGIQYPGHKNEISLEKLISLVGQHFSINGVFGQDIGRKMFMRHIQKLILKKLGQVFNYSNVDFSSHSMTPNEKASYIMVFGFKIKYPI